MKTIGSKVVFGDTIRSLTQTESISQLSHRSIKFSSASGLFPSSNESPRVIPIRIFMATETQLQMRHDLLGADFQVLQLVKHRIEDNPPGTAVDNLSNLLGTFFAASPDANLWAEVRIFVAAPEPLADPPLRSVLVTIDREIDPLG